MWSTQTIPGVVETLIVMTGGECSVNKTIIIVSVYLQYMYIDSIVCVVHLVKKGDARP